MIERLSELEGKVQSARAALEGLAERAARLRARLEADPEIAGEGPPDPEGTALVSPDVEVDATPADPETTALASSLERLTKNTAWVPVAGGGSSEGDDGRLVSD